MPLRRTCNNLLAHAGGVTHYNYGAEMKSEYDLTTVAGLRTAVADVRRNPLAKIMFGNSLWLADKGLEILEKAIDAVSPGEAVEKQAKAATDLIKAGKENGVKKMKITMDEQAGAHLDTPVEGVKVSAGIGSKGRQRLKLSMPNKPMHA